MVRNFGKSTVVALARIIASLLLGGLGGLISGAVVDRIWPVSVFSTGGSEQLSLAAFGGATGIVIGVTVGILMGATHYRVARGLDWAIVAGFGALVATLITGHPILESLAVALVCAIIGWLAALRADVYINFAERGNRLTARTLACYAIAFPLIVLTVMRGLAVTPS